MEKKITTLTWQQVKDAANKLPEEALSQPVIWWGDERGGTVHEIRILEADYVLTDEYWEELAEQDSVNPDDFHGYLPKGSPVISVD